MILIKTGFLLPPSLHLVPLPLLLSPTPPPPIPPPPPHSSSRLTPRGSNSGSSTTLAREVRKHKGGGSKAEGVGRRGGSALSGMWVKSKGEAMGKEKR